MTDLSLPYSVISLPDIDLESQNSGAKQSGASPQTTEE